MRDGRTPGKLHPVPKRIGRPPTRGIYDVAFKRHKPASARAHPVIKRIFSEINEQRIPYSILADRVGISRRTLEAWRSAEVSPSLWLVENTLNVLGLELTATYRKTEEFEDGTQSV